MFPSRHCRKKGTSSTGGFLGHTKRVQFAPDLRIPREFLLLMGVGRAGFERSAECWGRFSRWRI